MPRFYDVFTEDIAAKFELDEMDNFEKFANAGLVPPDGFNAPLYVMWELTSACPNRCVYCYNDSHYKREMELSGKQKFQIADQIIDAGVFQICLTGGEPRACPEYLDLIRYLRTNGVDVGTILSGALLTKKDIQEISEFLVMVQISLDGSNAAIHDKVRDREGSFKEAIFAIEEFIKRGVIVKVSFATTRYNIHDFKNVYELCSKLGVSSVRTQPLAITGRAKQNEKDIYPTREQYKELEEFIRSKAQNPKGNIPIEYRNPYEHVKFGLKNGYAFVAKITSQGLVGISPYVNVYFGDLKKESLIDIWKRMNKGWHIPKMMEISRILISRGDGILYDPTEETIFLGG